MKVSVASDHRSLHNRVKVGMIKADLFLHQHLILSLIWFEFAIVRLKKLCLWPPESNQSKKDFNFFKLPDIQGDRWHMFHILQMVQQKKTKGCMFHNLDHHPENRCNIYNQCCFCTDQCNRIQRWYRELNRGSCHPKPQSC